MIMQAVLGGTSLRQERAGRSGRKGREEREVAGDGRGGEDVPTPAPAGSPGGSGSVWGDPDSHPSQPPSAAHFRNNELVFPSCSHSLPPSGKRDKSGSARHFPSINF